MSVSLRTFAVLESQLDAGADVAHAMKVLLDAASEERPQSSPRLVPRRSSHYGETAGDES